MMLLGSLTDGRGQMPCLVGVERDRVVMIAQEDLSRFSWPAARARLSATGTTMTFHDDRGRETHLFTPDLPDRFRWVMTPALEEAKGRRSPWWRLRRGPMLAGLQELLDVKSAAA